MGLDFGLAPQGLSKVFGVNLLALALGGYAIHASALPSIALQDERQAANNRKQASRGLDFANALLDEKRYSIAEEEYQRFLATNPATSDRAVALYGLARSQLFLQKFAEARRNLEAFLQLAPDHPSAPTALFRLGEAAYLMKDLGAARQALERYVEAYPRHTHQQYAWAYLGITLQELGDLVGARKAFEKELADYPESPLADRSRYNLARVLSAQGEYDRAIESLKSLASRPSSEWADRARLQIGQVQLDAGRPAEALRTFRQLEGLLTGALLADARLREADALVALKEPERAEAILLTVTSDNSASKSTFAQAALSLGSIYFERDDATRAYSTWDGALARATGAAAAPALLYRSAEALEKLGRTAEARSRYQSVAETAPGDVWADEALFNSARLALEAKDFRACRVLVNQFDSRFANSPLLPDVRLIEARATQLEGDPAKAIKLLEALTRDEAAGPATRQSALHFLSQAYTATKQPEKAAQILEELARIPQAPLAGNAQFTLGKSHFDAQRYDEAVAAFEAYVQGHEKDELTSHALAYLVLCYNALNRAVDRDRCLSQLVRDWPQSDSLARVRLRLAESAIDAKRFDEAIGLLRPILEGKAGSWTGRARVDLAWALVGTNKPEEAARLLAEPPPIAREAPEAAEAAFLRGYALEAAGKDSEAEEVYLRAASDFSQSTESIKARLACARLRVRSSRPADAISLFEDVIKSTDRPLPDGETRDEILVDLARAQSLVGREEEAAKTYQLLLTEHADSGSALLARLQLAESAFRAKQFSRAREFLAPLLADTPLDDSHAAERERAWFRLGRIALEENKLEEGRDAFSRMATLFPDGKLKDEGRFWHAEALYRMGSIEQAEPEFAALAGAASDPPPAGQSWRDSARLRRLQCLVALGRWSDVMSEAQQFLADRPAFPQIGEIHYARGRALASSPPPRFEEARDAYQAAIDASPRSELAARSQFMRGETFMFQKNYKEALREFHQVELLYKAPKWQAAALLEAGKAYEALRQPNDAIDSYKKLIGSYAQDANAAEARERLSKLQAQ